VAQSIKKSRGENTRAIILETALRLFRERGFEETTMRSIAEEAGVSLGNAYYYFRSKDELVQDFYFRLQESQLAACEGILATEKGLKNRLSGIIRAHLAVATPYQRLFVSLFRIAADPDNELNPFSRATAPVRKLGIARFAEVVNGGQEKVSPDLRAELPYLLWLYHCGIVLFWIYDRSPNFVRTYRLLEVSSEMITNLIGIASMPIMTPVRQGVLRMVESAKSI
jgi:AcrR family transcriptional regulator